VAARPPGIAWYSSLTGVRAYVEATPAATISRNAQISRTSARPVRPSADGVNARSPWRSVLVQSVIVSETMTDGATCVIERSVTVESPGCR
jgi:hypothetical protein